MRTSLIALSLLISLFTKGHSQISAGKDITQNAALANWQVHKNAVYEISYPPNWEMNTNGLMATDFLLFSPVEDEADLFRENVSLLVQDLTGYDLDLERYTKISEEQITMLVTNDILISSERKGTGDNAYQKVIYSGEQGIYELQFEQYYWVRNDKAYVLTFTAEQSEFEKYRKDGEHVLESFKFK